jgi:hypothetical protein
MTVATRLEPSVSVLLLAVAIAGATAAYLVSPALWIATPMVAWVIARAALRDGQLPGAPEVDIRELPALLRQRVRSVFTRVPTGDARRLLLNVVNQARLVFARDESRFDASEEARLREHVGGLVDACCTTALDLSRLDEFTAPGASADSTGRTDLTARATKARELFRERLTNAASALAELYTSNVERGTPSTDRVAELTAEISADASARAAATKEMSDLLDRQ